MNDRRLMKRPDVAFSLMRDGLGHEVLCKVDRSDTKIFQSSLNKELRLAKISKAKFDSTADAFSNVSHLVLLCKPNIIRFGETLEFEFACKVDFNQKT